MSASIRRILLVFAALALICSCGRDTVIPRRTLSRIYADMLLTEAWLKAEPDREHSADSLWIYEPIFNKYGYTTEDYWNTVNEYMKDPDKFAKVLDRAAEKLEDESAYIEAEKVWTDAMASYRNLREKDSLRRWFFVFDSVFVDKLAPWKNPEMSLDTTVNVYLPYYDERRDSVRTDSKPKTRKFLGDKPFTSEGEALQF